MIDLSSFELDDSRHTGICDYQSGLQWAKFALDTSIAKMKSEYVSLCEAYCPPPLVILLTNGEHAVAANLQAVAARIKETRLEDSTESTQLLCVGVSPTPEAAGTLQAIASFGAYTTLETGAIDRFVPSGPTS